MAHLVGTLWATEPGPPLRTHLAFAAVAATVAGAAVVLHVRARTRRRRLLERRRELEQEFAA